MTSAGAKLSTPPHFTHSKKPLAADPSSGLIPQSSPPAIPFHIDKSVAVKIETNRSKTRPRKHNDIRAHRLHQAYQQNSIRIQHIPSAQNPADFIKKTLFPFVHSHQLTLKSTVPNQNHYPQEHHGMSLRHDVEVS